jgi:hypothetical protein
MEAVAEVIQAVGAARHGLILRRLQTSDLVQMPRVLYPQGRWARRPVARAKSFLRNSNLDWTLISAILKEPEVANEETGVAFGLGHLDFGNELGKE